ncbi:MAG: hypothetical protein WBM28_07690 [Burkholderiales bacterium]
MAIQTAKAALFLPARSNSRRFEDRFAAVGTDHAFPAIQQPGFFVDGHMHARSTRFPASLAPLQRHYALKFLV